MNEYATNISNRRCLGGNFEAVNLRLAGFARKRTGILGIDSGPVPQQFPITKPTLIGDAPFGLGRLKGTDTRLGDHVPVNYAPKLVQEEDGKMKNTGKRIFYTALLIALVNLPVIVLAGHTTSAR